MSLVPTQFSDRGERGVEGELYAPSFGRYTSISPLGLGDISYLKIDLHTDRPGNASRPKVMHRDHTRRSQLCLFRLLDPPPFLCSDITETRTTEHSATTVHQVLYLPKVCVCVCV